MKEINDAKAFFQWRKIFVRGIHLFLVLFVTSGLIIKDTGIYLFPFFCFFFINFIKDYFLFD